MFKLVFCVLVQVTHLALFHFSRFSQTHTIGNIAIIANFLSTYIYSFLLYLQHMMEINVKSDASRYKKTIHVFQGYMLHWPSFKRNFNVNFIIISMLINSKTSI